MFARRLARGFPPRFLVLAGSIPTRRPVFFFPRSFFTPTSTSILHHTRSVLPTHWCRFPPIISARTAVHHRGFSSGGAPDVDDLEALQHMSEKMAALDVLKAEEILSSKDETAWRTESIEHEASLQEAVDMMQELYVGSLIVRDGEKIVGIITETDVLHRLARSAKRDKDSRVLKLPVYEVMTKADKMIFASPDDKASNCLSILLEFGIRNLPVVDDHNKVVGVLSMRDLVLGYDRLLRSIRPNADVAGAKAMFLRDIMPRLGLPEDSQLTDDARVDENLFTYVDASATVIPHPNKRKTGGEDAHFIVSKGPDGQGDNAMAPFTALGVADGVGSWSFERNVDASKFSRTVMSHAREFIEHHWDVRARISERRSDMPSPLEVLSESWERTKADKVVGSSTVCLLTLDGQERALRGVNLGDSGFLVLRSQISLDAVGTLHRPRKADSHRHIVYRSPQQLHEFNCPLQLGIGLHGETNLFDQPHEAANIYFKVADDDLIVLASDGFFDNVDESRMLEVIGEGTDPVDVLSKKLAKCAYDCSMDDDHDSPFAVLAKDHNILWSGGRPDDITVVVARVHSFDATSSDDSDEPADTA